MDDKGRVLRMCEGLVDAQPRPVREALSYCAAMMLINRGIGRLVETVPGDDGAICIYQDPAGELYAFKRPMMSREREAEILEALEGVLRDAGLI